MKAKPGTYLVEFANGDQVIFGNNYKSWAQHALEFIYYKYGNKEHGWRYQDVATAVKDVKYSNQPFYDDGGLKWCGINAYQEVIDKVCGMNQLAPVKVEDIVFNSDPMARASLVKKLKEY